VNQASSSDDDDYKKQPHPETNQASREECAHSCLPLALGHRSILQPIPGRAISLDRKPSVDVVASTGRKCDRHRNNGYAVHLLSHALLVIDEQISS
jgi:hypothetical protein